METMANTGARPVLASPTQLQDGIASLSRGAYIREASLDMALSILTESAARISGVERVSIWALTGDHCELCCMDLYELSRQRHGSGERIMASHHPAYFRALRCESGIVADDAAGHPATAEFANDYLARHRIAAVLDTPIHIRGEFQGVLSFEQVGTRDPWHAAHRLFAHAVANMVTLALVEHEAEQARDQARTAREHLRKLFELKLASAGDAAGAALPA